MNRGALIVITVQRELEIGAGYASHYTVAQLRKSSGHS